MRYAYLIFGFAVIMVLSIFGFRGRVFDQPPLRFFDDMDEQPRYHPQGSSRFFADGRADRLPPPNTVPYGYLRGREAVVRARDTGGQYVQGFPMPVDETVMLRGRERYEINCAICHGTLGDGNGVTREYGMLIVPTFHDDRIRNMPEGELFDVITNGRNTMFPYADKVVPEDRWAIVAYLRALQRAQMGTVDDVPPANRPELGL